MDDSLTIRKQSWLLVFVTLIAIFSPIIVWQAVPMSEYRSSFWVLNIGLIELTIIGVTALIPFYWSDGLTWRRIGESIKGKSPGPSLVVGMIPIVMVFVASRVQHSHDSPRMAAVFARMGQSQTSDALVMIAISLVVGAVCVLVGSQPNRGRGFAQILMLQSLPAALVAVLMGGAVFRLSPLPFMSLVNGHVIALAAVFVFAYRENPVALATYFVALALEPLIVPSASGMYHLGATVVAAALLLALQAAGAMEAGTLKKLS
ncbi:MAG: hypothetical protein JST51_09205 [Armatimonadetes bacterium]|nr:hypothetical protein [Armatimonadota bacterium]